ncbi:MAG: YbaK/EbsC family protein [Alphaproteobacteria bacterium]|nr:YbaK/EbsC family protein [Alphaproteobacteria bacterium]MBP7729641.1 YbaK/EbsC family protein [Alphaproteobacteria bacterium]
MLSKNAQHVQNTLLEKGLEFKVIELPSSTRTAVEAAETIGCDVAQIIKSLVFQTKKSHKPILVLASGVNRVNEQILSELVGEKIEKADAGFTRKVTGFAIGGVPPVGHSQRIETVIDEDLLKFNKLWAAAGTPSAVFSLDSVNLKDLTQGKVAAIK